MKPIDDLSINEVCQELEEYTALSGDEWQEGVDALINIHRYSYVFGDTFKNQIEEELRVQLDFVRNNARIVEVTKEETKTVTYKQVEWDI